MKPILQIIRAPFLLLAVFCSLYAISFASFSGYSINWLEAFSIIFASVIGHVLVNVLNEVNDHKTGLDFITKRTPFSGGSGALQENDALLNKTIYIVGICLFLLLLIGLYFVFYKSFYLLLFGLSGILISYIYTPILNKSPLLSIASAGLGFSLIIGTGSFIAITGTLSSNAFLFVLPLFFLVSNLLLINQYPDKAADEQVGRRTFPMILGFKTSTLIVVFNYLACFASILTLVLIGTLPLFILFSLTVLLISILVVFHLSKAEQTNHLIEAMKFNVMINLLLPLVSSIILFVS